MARYQIIISYDGTHFVGSQRQAESRTVQSVIETALRRLGWEGKSILLSGRTDTGVHASGQVAAFDFEWTHPLDALHRALNANLPLDVSISRIKIVPDGFHPRFDATARRYVYRLFCQPVRNPLQERYAWRVWPDIIDAALLQETSRLLVGQHDFASFGSPPRALGSTLRKVMHTQWSQNANAWTFEVQANAFLYHMVRRMVYVQVAVGQGRISLKAVQDALENQIALPAGLADACGLSLVEVTYPLVDNLE